MVRRNIDAVRLATGMALRAPASVAGARAAIVTRLASMGYPVEPTKEQRK